MAKGIRDCVVRVIGPGMNGPEEKYLQERGSYLEEVKDLLDATRFTEAQAKKMVFSYRKESEITMGYTKKLYQVIRAPLTPKYPYIQVRLGPKDGPDGNAFVVLGVVEKAMKQYGVPDRVIKEFAAQAQSGNYNHLLNVVASYVDFKFARGYKY